MGLVALEVRCLKVSFIVSNEIHALCKIATVVYLLKRFQVVIGGVASLYSAPATLTVNRKGVGTLELVEVSAVALAIAWPRYALAAVTLVPRASAAARSRA